ncbi:MAG: tetratricopeptide repeat protein [Streptomyces sp.]|nr:tetratricopeptide repeat protein [Streptomyces sp.]
MRFTSLRRPYVDAEAVRGRGPELDRLWALLRRPHGRFGVVCGAGGFGKTTLAAALAERAEQHGYTVFWIRWQDRDSFVVQMTQVAVACGMDDTDLQAARTELVSLPDAVWRRLGATRRWLLVVDNVDQAEQLGLSPGSVGDYRGWVRPEGDGLLLLTSRDTSRETWGPRAQLVELSVLDGLAGAEVLRDAAPQAGSAQDAEKLSERLGGLPLALRSAGAYIARPGSRYQTFDDYRSALDRDPSALLGASDPVQRSSDAVRQAVRHTWELSLDQLESTGSPTARPLLRMLSLLADAPIPQAWITPVLLRSVTDVRVRNRDVEAALTGLHQFGLLGAADRAQYGDTAALLIHPLVREINAFLLASSPGVDIEVWRRAALLRTAQMAARLTRDSADWPTARVLAPHVQLLFEHRGLVSEDLVLNARSRVLAALFAAGEFAPAAALARAAYVSDETTYGAEHARTDKSRSMLCGALGNLGRHAEVAGLMREALARQTQVLGPDHHRTLQSKRSLGTALSNLGQYDEALALLRETVAQRERVVGPDNALTLISRRSLANALSNSGRYAEAAEIHRHMLQMQLAAAGADDPKVLRSRNNLAVALDGLGRHAEAVELLRDTLHRREASLGPDHPHTLATRHNLAVTLLHQGQRAEALDLLRQALESRERVMGLEHAATLATRRVLRAAQRRRPLTALCARRSWTAPMPHTQEE